MRIRKSVLLLGITLAFWNTNTQAQSIVTLQLTNYIKEMQALQMSGEDIAGVDYDNKRVDLVVDEFNASFLTFKTLPVFEQKSIKASPDPGYKTSEEVEALLRNNVQMHPEISELIHIGNSLEGRPIYAIRITGNASEPNGTKPTILFNGMHHAREVMSTEVPIDIIDTLLQGYGNDARITHWVDTNVIYVIPMLNVDGNRKVWNGNPSWRKNTSGMFGVDINRNYPYLWGTCDGSSSISLMDNYRGPSAASEPETRVMMAFVDQIRPVFDISFHSYSELVLYPYGCRDQHTLIQEVIGELGTQMASLLPKDRGQGNYTPGTPWEILYATDGDDISWMHHEMQVIPFVIEVNSRNEGFQPSYADWRDHTVTKLRAAWQFLLERLDGPSIRGSLVADDRNTAIEGSTILIERLDSHQESFTQNYRVNPNGRFFIVLKPGRYRLTFQAPGFQTQTVERNSEIDERLDLNVRLIQN